MTYVIGIDTGGTFTDAFVADENGRLAAAKTPSTPPNFAEGFLTAVDAWRQSWAFPCASFSRRRITSCTAPPRP